MTAEPDEVRLGFADARVRVVGVSHYQDALREIAGADAGEAVRHEATAALVPEPDNPHDPNAIRVTIGGRLVGYLSREDAVRYRPAVDVLQESGRVLTSAAVIGGRGPDSETANLGVFLQLPWPTEAEMEARSVAGG
jgi:HIRAN domain